MNQSEPIYNIVYLVLNFFYTHTHFNWANSKFDLPNSEHDFALAYFLNRNTKKMFRIWFSKPNSELIP